MTIGMFHKVIFLKFLFYKNQTFENRNQFFFKSGWFHKQVFL